MNPNDPASPSGASDASVSAQDAFGPSARNGNLILAVAFGLAGALAGATVWGLISYHTKYELGILAWGIGFLVGFLVAKPGGCTGLPAQLIAVVCALLGVVGGKYGAFYGYFNDAMVAEHGAEVAAEYSLFAFETIQVFIEFLPEMLSPFDALWAILALSSAWKLTSSVQEG